MSVRVRVRVHVRVRVPLGRLGWLGLLGYPKPTPIWDTTHHRLTLSLRKLQTYTPSTIPLRLQEERYEGLPRHKSGPKHAQVREWVIAQ